MTIKLQGYEQIETVFQSSRTIIYRAIRKQDNKKVIIKTLRKEYPSFQEFSRIRFENDMLQQLDIPGTIKIYALEQLGNKPAIVMEDFAGTNLSSAFPGAISLDDFFNVALKIVKIIQDIHHKNIIHKDINPRNILINLETNEIKIIDFNIATDLAHEKQDINTETPLEGSLAYISPEQTGRMNRNLDYRTDYYSLGVTFFELLTGKLPFTAKDSMGYVHCHLSKPTPDLQKINTRIPKAVARIIQKLMAKNVEKRYQSSHGLIKDLELCQQQWSEKGAIEDIPLGEHDISQIFHIPQKLYGREKEITTLVNAFESVSAGHKKLLLVAGPSGVGKTSLVSELNKPIVDKKGYFLSGKFDQYKRNIPYSVINQALKGLVRQMLSGSDSQLEYWKSRIQRALGVNGQLMIDIVPEIEKIIGGQPSVNALTPKEAQVRFQTVFVDFVRVFARREHPLVIFLDDLQWSDFATIDLMKELLKSDLDYLLLLGSYRNNEVDKGHPLQMALEDIQKNQDTLGQAFQQLFLSPLNEGAICRMMADTLRQNEDTIQPLARFIYKGAKGNPFYTRELLTILYQNGAFEFLIEDGRWNWDLIKIEEMVSNGNVDEFLIKQLPTQTLEIIKLASCIGDTFDLVTLATISQKSPFKITELLWPTVKQGFLLPLGDKYSLSHGQDSFGIAPDTVLSYQFQHDRIRQAVYSLIAVEDKPAFHLKIGRALLFARGENDGRQRLFDPVNHLNKGAPLIHKQIERLELVELNAKAGNEAKAATVFAIAAEFYHKGLLLLSENEWKTYPGKRFRLTMDYAEALFLSAKFNKSMELCEKLLGLATNKLEEVSVHALKSVIYSHQAKLFESAGEIRKGLNLLNIHLPEKPQEIDIKIGEGFEKLQIHLSKISIEELINLPKMKDEEKIMASNLLFQIIPVVIQICPPLFVLAELIMFDLAATHGYTPFFCKNLVDIGILKSADMSGYAEAYRFGELALKLLDKHQVDSMRSAVYFVFSAFLSPFKNHYLENIDYLTKSIQMGLQTGDLHHSVFAYSWRLVSFLYIGRNLEDCMEEADKIIAFFNKIQTSAPLDITLIVQNAVQKLQIQPNANEAKKFKKQEEQILENIKQTSNTISLLMFGKLNAFVAFILGDMEKAEKWSDFAAQSHPGNEARISLPDYFLIQILIKTRTWKDIPENERVQQLDLLEQKLKHLKIWSDSCSPNFSHKYFLAAAEIERIKGKNIESVINLYQLATSSIGKGEFVHMKALINELQGEFWLEHKQETIAKTFMLRAHQLYTQWGSFHKVSLLERKYYNWFSGTDIAHSMDPHSTSISSKALDIGSIMKSTQALSSEIKIEKLQKKLIHVMMENAGAQRGFLILKNEITGELLIEAKEEIDEILVNQSIPLQESGNLCVEVVNYVVRTQKEVVLNNAQKEADYRTNPYIQKQCVKSIICLPVLYQNRLKGILYLENNLVDNAFSPSHVSVLKMISAQAAISLGNAYIYNNLDKLVKQRTLQLEAVQEELVANAHKAGMSDIASNILHNVGNALNSLKTTSYSLAQTIIESHIEDLLKANDLLKQNINDVENFILKSSKGKKLLNYYLDIGDILKNEKESVLNDLKRLQEKADIITDMVSAQQKYVHISNFTEMIDVHEVINNALAIRTTDMQSRNITVEKQFQPVPRLLGQKIKLMHVLVNLIENAEEAILKKGKSNKKIRISVNQDEKQVFVTIADDGCGINKENLTKVFAYGISSKKGSHGIGLHSSANYVSEMKGKIWAESEGKGKGTKVNLSFPIMSE